MRRYLLTAALLMLTAAANGRGVDVTEKVTLRFLDAKSVPTLVKASSGLDRLTLNIKDNSLTVSGSPEAIAAFKTELRNADVQPAIYRLAMHLVRFDVNAAGRVEETIVMAPTMTTFDKISATCTTTTVSASGSASGLSVTVTTRQDGEGMVLLTAEVRELGEQGEVVRSGRNERRVALGKVVRITGMTDTSDKILRRATLKGEVINDRGPYTGYYLDVEPVLSR